ncbi:hypothetical protein ACFU9B_38425 [Streptomyces sp. NPDC057592]|uniref:hypothetical protein n=1 Tax=unclassified Streptomyces TaxID=2593676 RepID=UPI0036951F1A
MTGTLYHFTSPDGWDKIRSSGAITPHCNRVPHVLFEGPVVWLQDSDSVDDNGLSGLDGKNRVRIAVRPTPAMQYWPVWKAGVAMAEALERIGTPASWYVTRESIPEDFWGEALDLVSGAPLRSGPATHSVTDWGDLPDLAEWETVKQSWARLQLTEHTVKFVPYRSHIVNAATDILDSEQSEQRRRAAWRSVIATNDFLKDRPTTA